LDNTIESSNCGRTEGARVRYYFYEQLVSAGLVVDVYGGCGKPILIDKSDPAFFEVFSK